MFQYFSYGVTMLSRVDMAEYADYRDTDGSPLYRNNFDFPEAVNSFFICYSVILMRAVCSRACISRGIFQGQHLLSPQEGL